MKHIFRIYQHLGIGQTRLILIDYPIDEMKKISIEMFFSFVETQSRYSIHEVQEVLYKRYYCGTEMLTEVEIDLFYLSLKAGKSSVLRFGKYVMEYEQESN